MPVIWRQVVDPQARIKILKNLMRLMAKQGVTRAQALEALTTPPRDFTLQEIQTAFQELVAAHEIEEVTI